MIIRQWHDAFIALLLGDADPQAALSNGTETFPLPERQQVYRNNYRQGLIKCLSTVFERTHAHVGEDYFTQLARSYVQATPPTPAGLEGYGETFPQHLEQLAKQHAELAQMPWLPDLARLDWLCERAYHAPDRQRWPVEAFSGLPPEQQTQVCPILSPDCHLLASPWALSKLWALHAGGQDSITASELAQPEYLLVYRQQFRIRLEPLSSTVYHLLQAVAQGHSLNAIAQRHPEAGICHLPGLLANGWIHTFTLEDHHA